MNKICLYAIAKNESKNVDAWYETVKEADAVAVLDTGSSDDTIEKLKAHNVIVGEKAYDQFRFDQARNDSMELIPDDCNICMTIDIDERLSPGWADIIRNEWIDGKHERINYSYIFRDETYEISRNWGHSKNWSWLYPCHEVMKRNGVIWYEPEECLFLNGRVTVRHWPDLTKSRSSYMPLLELRLKENPNDDMSYVYLLREKYMAHKFLEIAGKYSKIKADADSFGNEQRGAALIYLGDSLYQISDLYTAITCYRDSIRANPFARCAYLRMAKALCDQRRYREAKDVLLECLKITKPNNFWNWVDTDSMWKWELYDWLGIVCYGLKEYEDAVMWSEKAINEDPNNKHLQSNYKLYLKKIQNGR